MIRIPRTLYPFVLLAFLGCEDRPQGDWNASFGFGGQKTKPGVRRETAPTNSSPSSDYAQVSPNYLPSRRNSNPGRDGMPEARPNGSRASRPTEWVTFRDPRKRYEASFPVGVMREAILNQTVQGKNYRTFVNGIQDGDRAYVVLVTENVIEPKTRQEIDNLDLEFMKLAVAGARGREGKYSKTLAGRGGIPASVLSFQNDTRTGWGKCYGFNVDDVAYQIVAIDAIGNEDAVERFLDDFRLLIPEGHPRREPKFDPSPRLPQPATGTGNRPKPGNDPIQSATPADGPAHPSATESPEEKSPSRPVELKPQDKHFPSMHDPDQKLAAPPPNVPQPDFPTLPTIPKIKPREKEKEKEKGTKSGATGLDGSASVAK